MGKEASNTIATVAGVGIMAYIAYKLLPIMMNSLSSGTSGAASLSYRNGNTAVSATGNLNALLAQLLGTQQKAAAKAPSTSAGTGSSGGGGGTPAMAMQGLLPGSQSLINLDNWANLGNAQLFNDVGTIGNQNPNYSAAGYDTPGLDSYQFAVPDYNPQQLNNLPSSPIDYSTFPNYSQQQANGPTTSYDPSVDNYAISMDGGGYSFA